MGQRHYFLAGGGTGGHLFPGIAVAEQLRTRDPDAQIVFVGSDRTIEREILARTSFDHQILSSSPLTGAGRHPLHFARRSWTSYRESMRLVELYRPVVVIGCGGFASVAPILAARRKRIPVVLLEQNAIPGRATRWLSRLAETTCLAFEETANRLSRNVKCKVTGNPVRTAIVEIATRQCSVSKKTSTLLILGGSQGARAINELTLAFAADSPSSFSEWEIVHQTGKEDESLVRETYAKYQIDATVSAFFEDTASLYAEADLVISRAGGTTLAELACAGVPAILIPYPHATDNHQWHNAEVFRATGAAALLDAQQDPASAQSRFRECLLPLIQNEATRATMASAMVKLARSQAAAHVADLIEELLTRRASKQP